MSLQANFNKLIKPFIQSGGNCLNCKYVFTEERYKPGGEGKIIFHSCENTRSIHYKYDNGVDGKTICENFKTGKKKKK
ncbi:MAG: hypothetical protein IPL26_30230 [Leptospiraceae bacterium]|nr:hypothetical protein [Leptospiraceae bacterium]